MPVARLTAPRRRATASCLLALSLALTSLGPAWAAPDGPPGRGGSERSHGGPGRGDGRFDGPGSGQGRVERYGPPGPDWRDRANGHDRRYANPGVVVRTPPPRSANVAWHGTPYRFADGIWYAPYGQRGYRVVSAPRGAVVPWLPLFRTAVVIGGLSYLYLNGTYYRERSDGYEVVAAPVTTVVSAPVDSGSTGNGSERLFVYPQRGQGSQQQASDEYDCHRWAVQQTGFDPARQATGTVGADYSRRDDYRRAQSACLEGRGYTVK